MPGLPERDKSAEISLTTGETDQFYMATRGRLVRDSLSVDISQGFDVFVC